MGSRLSRICDAIIEAGWLAALVVAPLFFNTSSNRVFEPDKIHLIRSIALVMAAAWLVQLLDGGLRRPPGAPGLWVRLRSTPLVLPALILVASYLISTALSVVPRISFVGSYVRMQGTFSFLSYVAIFAMVLTHLRRHAQVKRILHAVILTSLPIAIYGILQNAGLDPLPWGGDVRDRVAANMGNAIFVAAYLIMAFFLTLDRLLDSIAALFNVEQGGVTDSVRAGSYLFVLIVQTVAIIFTQSRGPWLGWFAGLYVFAMLGLLLLARWARGRTQMPAALGWLSRHVRAVWVTLIGLSAVTIALVVVLNIPNTPLKGLCETRYVSRICTLTSLTEGTNAVRALIWQGVVDLMLKPHAPIETPAGKPDPLNVIRPLIGYGPESMWVAYNRFYPPDLAHYESRNASPDRSHNETFDALVRGGLIQFSAALFLFGSVFYYALRWLGLMRGAGRRNLFLTLLVGGGGLGVLIPLLVDGRLRLAGIGLPAGLIFGVLVYVTVNLLRGDKAETTQATGTGGRRALLLLALFAAIVAHFVELHFGIAIASTLTHFWVLAATLVAVGMGWVTEKVEVEARVEAVVEAKGSEKSQPVASPTKRRPATAAGQPAAKRRGAPAATDSRRGPTPPAPVQPARRSALRPFLPYVTLIALISLVLMWDYLVNQTGAQNAWALLWDAFTVRVRDYQIVRSPALLMLVLFTWLVGALLAVTEGDDAIRQVAARLRWPIAAAIYGGAALTTFVLFGLIQAGRMRLTGLDGIAIFRRMAGHIVVFDLFLLLALLALAAALWRADPRPRPIRTFGATPALPLIIGPIVAGLAVWVIITVNIQTVQADTYYKQGLGYEAAGQWESSVVLYREAALLEPKEDYYYLFLGRALLQLSDTAPAGTSALPEDLSNVPAGDLLGLVDRGVRAGHREDVLRAAHAALMAAQRLNPLNTDHTANLARLHRAWAFSDAVEAQALVDSASLRAAVQENPNAVNLTRLARAETYYRQATALSPQNAVLWNELATVQFIKNDLAASRASLERSLAVDQRFSPTYLLQGDVLDAAGDTSNALASYRRAAELASRDLNALSALGVYSAQHNDTETSLQAFQRIVEIQTTAMQTAQAQLDQLNAQAAQAGGYTMLQISATNRRNTLQAQITGYQAQMNLSLRNMALVLRQAGRPAEALQAAEQALATADDRTRASIEALIADLKKQTSP